MSTITTPTRSRRAGADWIPSPLARLTVDQYEALVDSGVFTERDRFTLINGLLVAKLPKKRPHVIACDRARHLLERTIGRRNWHVMLEAPVRLPPKSEPEPDLSIVRGKLEDYPDHPPGPGDLAMVVEVADRTVTKDRKMVRVYGPSGIPVYWLINLKTRRVEVYTKPGPNGYASRSDFLEGQSVMVEINGTIVGEVAVADILPPIKPADGGN